MYLSAFRVDPLLRVLLLKTMPIFNSWLAPKIANLNCFLADYYTISSYPVQHVSCQARTPDVILQNPGNQTAKQNNIVT